MSTSVSRRHLKSANLDATALPMPAAAPVTIADLSRSVLNYHSRIAPTLAAPPYLIEASVLIVSRIGLLGITLVGSPVIEESREPRLALYPVYGLADNYLL